MKHQAFEKFVEEILKLNPFLDSNTFEKLANQYFREFQVSLGTNGDLTSAHLFSAHLDRSSTPNTLIADPKLPSDYNLTGLKINPEIGKPEYINDISSITSKILDPITRELILMPLLVHDFSEPFDISGQMRELTDGLRCFDDSKPKLDPESLTSISSNLIKHLAHFEAPDQSAKPQQMSLMQMFGILQTVEGFQKFGIKVRKPIARGACTKIDFAMYPDQAPRFHFNNTLDIKKKDGTLTLGLWNRGKIDLSTSGIRQPQTITHEFLHTFLRMYDPDVVLEHIDNLKTFKPLLEQGEFVPMSVLGTFYPSSYIPIKFTKNEGIGALDYLLLAAARNGGTPRNLPNSCNGDFIPLSAFLPKSCPDGNAPRLLMRTPYSVEMQSREEFKLLLNTVQIECHTAIFTGLFKLIATSLKLNEEAQKPILSTIETASRIGLVALYEDIESAKNLAIISALITSLKMIDFALQTKGFRSPKKFAQELVGKIGEATIGEEMTRKISNSPQELKKYASQLLFVFALHSIDKLIKHSENKDDKAQIPKIEDGIAFSILASSCSALIFGIIDIGVRKISQRQRQQNSVEAGGNSHPAEAGEDPHPANDPELSIRPPAVRLALEATLGTLGTQTQPPPRSP